MILAAYNEGGKQRQQGRPIDANTYPNAPGLRASYVHGWTDMDAAIHAEAQRLRDLERQATPQAPQPSETAQWLRIAPHTDRLRVPGGSLYRTTLQGCQQIGLCFAPDRAL